MHLEMRIETNQLIRKCKPWKKKKTWYIVELPKGKKIVGCKWIFTIKYKVDEIIEKYKSRFVAKGFTQTYDID